MRDLLPVVILGGLTGTLVGGLVALWLGRQQRRAHQHLLAREHQRNLVLDVPHALRLLETGATDVPGSPRDQHTATRREQQAQLRRVEDQLLVASLSADLVGRARAALEAAERYASLGTRAVLDGHPDPVGERTARRDDFVAAARRELRLRGPRRPRSVEPADPPTYAPRRAAG